MEILFTQAECHRRVDGKLATRIFVVIDHSTHILYDTLRLNWQREWQILG